MKKLTIEEKLIRKRISSKKYYHSHKEEYKRRGLAWKLRDPNGFKINQRKADKKFGKTPKGIYRILKQRSKRTKQRSPFQFTLSQKNFIDWYLKQKKICIYCGVHEYKIDKRLEIERKNNNIGYELENMALACENCNGVKGSILTYEEMKIVGEIIMKKRWET